MTNNSYIVKLKCQLLYVTNRLMMLQHAVVLDLSDLYSDECRAVLVESWNLGYAPSKQQHHHYFMTFAYLSLE